MSAAPDPALAAAVASALPGLPPAGLEPVLEAAAELRRLIDRDRPALYAMPAAKRRLVAALGPGQAGAVLAAVLRHRAPGPARPVRLVPLAEYAPAAADYRLLAPAREIMLRAPLFLGQPPAPARACWCRSSFTATLARALVMGKSNHLFVGEAAILDAEARELALCPLDHDVDPGLLLARAAPPAAGAGPEAPALFAVPPPPEVPRLARALSLTGIHTFAFGHWMLEFLPRLWHCMDQPGFDRVTILLDRQMPPQHFEALRCFVGSDHPIRVLEPGEMVLVERLLAMPMPIYMPAGPQPDPEREPPPLQALDPDAMLALIRKAESRLPGLPSASLPERLFLTRKPHQHRRLVNQPEVAAHLSRRGFEPVDMGDLPFQEQLALIRAARIVIAADGSALLLTLLAGPDTRIGNLTHAFPEEQEWYAELCDRLGQRYAMLIGETPHMHPNYRHFSDYRIDLAALDALVDLLEAA